MARFKLEPGGPAVEVLSDIPFPACAVGLVIGECVSATQFSDEPLEHDELSR